MRAARFPDPRLDRADPAGLSRAAALREAVSGMAGFVSPAPAAAQTAEAMGVTATVAPALAEADHGRWSGLPYEKVAREEPEDLARWLRDPHAVPHGGTSLAELAARVAAWLEAAPDGPVVAVCDAGAIRAALGHALGLDSRAAARFDLAPLSTTELTRAGDGGWRVAHVNRKVAS